MKYYSVIKYSQFYVSLIMAFLLGACSNVDYISREDLKDPKYDNSKSEIMKSTNFGAFKVKKKASKKLDINDDVQAAKSLYFNEEVDDSSLYIIQRRKGAYQVETKFHESNHKSYFFSFGLDYKNKAPRVGFRLEF